MRTSDMRARPRVWSRQTGKGHTARVLGRRHFVERAILFTTVMLAAIPLRRDARAQAKVSQQQARYQDHPKDEQKCADCRHFIAEQGACQRVDGSISPNGWCALWATKA